ncbi:MULTISPECIES: hypothetical protein [Erythrobacteraceae]|jgi:hypothetical protein|uniref:hypothetical protein n=1 Tax=Erythrobacteraceae TaxID=335929 RepID=UPI001FF16B25|nr:MULTISPECIES: hypothetical protein [Erythrobacteraceae]MCK0099563.1 hypothetical protein [Qipengyuania sp. S6317L1]
MRKFKIAVALAGPGMMVGPALAQNDVTPAPLAGVWSLGETASCESGPAWVFFADGYYAEVQLPDGAPAALRIWRDEGDAIAYTHAHMPFAGHERPMRVRHLTIEERSSERLVTRNYRGVARIFHRCPATSLKAPKGQSGH